MRYRRQNYPGQSYFFTVVTADRRPLFTEPQRIDLLRDAIAEVKGRRPFDIVAAVILPDHLHMIWHLPEGDGDHSTRWRLIKERFTRASGLVRQRPAGAKPYGRVWQHRYWEHRIRDDADMEKHVGYIHHNPVKHGLVPDPYDWPYSSIHSPRYR